MKHTKLLEWPVVAKIPLKSYKKKKKKDRGEVRKKKKERTKKEIICEVSKEYMITMIILSL